MQIYEICNLLGSQMRDYEGTMTKREIHMNKRIEHLSKRSILIDVASIPIFPGAPKRFRGAPWHRKTWKSDENKYL